MKHLAQVITDQPAKGWIGALVAEILALIGWTADHAGQLGSIFGMFAAIFGAIAGWYTFRIQRRVWQDGEAARGRKQSEPDDSH